MAAVLPVASWPPDPAARDSLQASAEALRCIEVCVCARACARAHARVLCMCVG